MISACMIVRDEEDVIQRCLSWLKHVVGSYGEICIVDTGSIDHTAERVDAFAKANPDIAIRFQKSARWHVNTPPETFHFGEARNESLFLASKPWSFWCDADDIMDGQGLLGLSDLVRSKAFQEGEKDGYRFTYKMPDGGEYLRLRLFKTALRLYFRGAAHEYLPVPVNSSNLRHIKIHHAPPERDSGQPRAAGGNVRVAQLATEVAEEDRKNPRTLFYYANELRNDEKIEDALKVYQEYLTKSTWPEERRCAQFYSAICHRRLNNPEAVYDTVDEARNEDPRFADELALDLTTAVEAADFEEARSMLSQIRLLPFPADAILFTNPRLYLPATHEALEARIAEAEEATNPSPVVEAAEGVQLDVIWRSCTGVPSLRNKPRIVDCTKFELAQRCLRSLLLSLQRAKADTRLWIVDDHSEEEHAATFLKEAKEAGIACTLVNIEGSGNQASLQASLLVAQNEARELIYFVEDDYLHEPSAVDEMIKVWQQQGCTVVVHPTDYKDRYPTFARQSTDVYPSTIFVSEKRHWRTVLHTTGTIMLSKAILEQCGPNFAAFASSCNEEGTLNEIYKVHTCVSPMPTLAWHLQDETTVAPIADWHPAWLRTDAAVISNKWYDNIAKRFLKKGERRDRPKEFEAAAKFCKGKIIEFGCMFGEFTKYLPEDATYLGVDISTTAVAEAMRSFPGRDFIVDDLRTWAAEGDTVVAMQVIEHFETAEIAGILSKIAPRCVFSVPRKALTKIDRIESQHLVGYEDDAAFSEAFRPWGTVEYFEGVADHICGVITWQGGRP